MYYISGILGARLTTNANSHIVSQVDYIFYTTGPVMVSQSYLDFKQKDDVVFVFVAFVHHFF